MIGKRTEQEPMSGEPEHRVEWLGLARQQSQRLADSRARLVPPMRWERRRSVSPVARQRRLSWSMLLLPLLLLGGATGTWAFVRHLNARKQVAPAAPEQPETVPAPAQAGAPAGPRIRRPREVVERPVVERRDEHPRRRAAPRAVEKKPQTPPQQPSAARYDDKPQTVVFGSSSEPVIIVNPPSKFGPLWSPEDYKKQKGGRRADW